VVSRQTLDVDMVDGADGSTAGSEGGLPSPRPRQQQDEEGLDYLKYVPESYGRRLPSMEALFTLAWICEVEIKKQQGKGQRPGKSLDVGTKRRQRLRLSELMKPEYPTWEAEQRFNLDPKSRLME